MKPLVITVSIVYLFALSAANSHSKYSKEANVKPSALPKEFLDLDRPFRMNKVNLLWSKAKQRLGKEKLKNLATDLFEHDKEELTLKRIKADGLDKDGMKEAEIRKKFHKIMVKYNLEKHLDATKNYQSKDFNEPHELNKAVFKDKKLNKLWEKAEKSDEFSVEQLMTLKQEFQHHEEKVSEYYQLLNELHADNSSGKEYDNTIEQYLNSQGKSAKSIEERVQSLREKHTELKEDYENLNQKIVPDMSLSGSGFTDYKVKMLWKLAKEAGFSSHELASLKEELDHYEQRAVKLNHMEAQLTVMNEKHADDAGKDDAKQHLSKKIKQMSHKVNKLHIDIETRIKERHAEL